MRKHTDFDSITPHFRLSEFASKTGEKIPPEYRSNVIKLARSLEKVREICACPLRITSGFRTPEENASTPGASKNSLHLKAIAGDLKPISTYWTPPMLAGIFETLIRQNHIPDGELGVYKNHIHYAPTGIHSRWIRLS